MTPILGLQSFSLLLHPHSPTLLVPLATSANLCSLKGTFFHHFWSP